MFLPRYSRYSGRDQDGVQRGRTGRGEKGLEIVSDTSYGLPNEPSWTLSPPQPVTYTQLDTICTHLTSGLVHLGFTDPSAPISSRARVSIYADTCLNWQLMAQSFARLGHVITTAYTTLGEDGLLTSLVEPDVELVFCGEAQLGLVGKVVGRVEKVRFVVYDGEERVDKVSRKESHPLKR